MNSWKNIVLIVMDCSRYCLITPKITPFLTELSSKGVTYHSHYSTAPWTLPSHVSLFTGLYTREHGVEHENMILHSSIRTIAELFKDCGYATACITNNPWLGPLTGTDRGFDNFYGIWAKKLLRMLPIGHKLRQRIKKVVMSHTDFLNRRDSGAARTLEQIKNWHSKIYDSNRPYFLMLNFMECHHPYRPPQPFLSRFYKSDIDPLNLEQDFRKINGKCSDKIVDFDALRMLCDGEQAYLDSRLQELFRFLDDDNTVWIITSDHGDLLGEEGGRVGHRFSLHRNLLHVPLIIYDGVNQGSFDKLTQHTDLYEAMTAFIDIGGKGFPLLSRYRSFGVAEHSDPVPLLKQLEEEKHFGPKFDLNEHSRDLFSIFTNESQVIERNYKDGRCTIEYYPNETELPSMFRSWRTHWEEHCIKPPPLSPSPGFDATLKYLRERGFF